MDFVRSPIQRFVLAECEDFRLENCRISPSTRKITGPLGEALLEPRVMQVLLALHDAQGRVLGREELLESCWDGRIVGDDAINRAIAGLRRAMAETGCSCEVETVARVGYRLKSPQSPQPEDRPARMTRRSVIAGSLAAATALTLGSGFLLLRQRGTEQAKLDQIAHDIRTAIFTATPASLKRAEDTIGQAAALGLDDGRRLGLEALLLAQKSDMLAGIERVELNARAMTAVDAALAADPRQSDARVAEAVLHRGLVSWKDHEATLRQVLSEDSDCVVAMAELGPFLQSVGRSAEARELNLRAASLYPMGALLQQRRALIHWIFGMDDEAVRIITRAGEIWPEHRLIAASHLLLLSFTGRTASALTFLDDPLTNARLALPPIAVETWRTALRALAQESDRQEAAATLVETAMSSPGLAANCTMLLSHLGFADEAYRVADRLVLGVVQSGSGDSDAAYNDPRWRETQWLFTPAARTMREDPRFTGFCEAMGYLDYWRDSGNWPDEAQRGSLAIA